VIGQCIPMLESRRFGLHQYSIHSKMALTRSSGVCHVLAARAASCPRTIPSSHCRSNPPRCPSRRADRRRGDVAQTPKTCISAVVGVQDCPLTVGVFLGLTAVRVAPCSRAVAAVRGPGSHLAHQPGDPLRFTGRPSPRVSVNGLDVFEQQLVLLAVWRVQPREPLVVARTATRPSPGKPPRHRCCRRRVHGPVGKTSLGERSHGRSTQPLASGSRPPSPAGACLGATRRVPSSPCSSAG
jgi:hypothetical protein